MVALSFASFANTWQTTEWKGTVAADQGGKEKAPANASLEVKKNAKGELEANFWNGKETWAFSGDTYTWNDGTVKVTAKKVALKDVSSKVKGLDTLKGVAGSTDVTVYSNPTCEKVTPAGDCNMPKDIFWGFSTTNNKNNFFYGFNLPENKGQRFLSIAQK